MFFRCVTITNKEIAIEKSKYAHSVELNIKIFINGNIIAAVIDPKET